MILVTRFHIVAAVIVHILKRRDTRAVDSKIDTEHIRVLLTINHIAIRQFFQTAEYVVRFDFPTDAVYAELPVDFERMLLTLTVALMLTPVFHEFC